MRKAFTLVELIVAISIIAILLALGVYGVTSALEATREASTKQTLAGINSLLSERVKSLNGQIYPARWYHRGVYAQHNTAFPGLWISPFRTFVGTVLTHEPTTVVDTAIPDDGATWTSDLLRNTVIIFAELNRFPAPHAAIAKLKTISVTVNINGVPVTAMIPVDGWGRPLLFAPGVGITTDGVTVYQQSTAVAYSVPFGGKGGTYPFVFSAGKDGNPSDIQGLVR